MSLVGARRPRPARPRGGVLRLHEQMVANPAVDFGFGEFARVAVFALAPPDDQFGFAGRSIEIAIGQDASSLPGQIA